MSVASLPHPLKIEAVSINEHCTGSRWTIEDVTQLSKLVAIIVMGQVIHASYIIKNLMPANVAFANNDLKKEAAIKLTVQNKQDPSKPRVGYPRYQRDGLVFEIISWIAARQCCSENAYIKDPHISSTTQGTDGLMIELCTSKKNLLGVTIFEDKCTERPEYTFRYKVVKAFEDRHNNKRSAELIALAGTLIRMSGVDEGECIQIAGKVVDKNIRCYRAAFAVESKHDTTAGRRSIFAGYEAISGITAKQRLGANLVVDESLRKWFDKLSAQSVVFINSINTESDDV